MKPIVKNIFSMLFLILICVPLLSACQKTPSAAGTSVNLAVLKGPTGIGAVNLMESNEKNESLLDYNFTILGSPDETLAKIINGEIDIAAIPSNLASTLYNKLDGGISILALNTLGVLSIVENGNSINSISDLSGKTILTSGQGAVPEYVLNYILEKNNVSNVTISYLPEHSEVAVTLLSKEGTIALLPEPNVTAALLSNPNIKIALDITKEWEALSGKDNPLPMGCIVARKEFLDNNKDAVNLFLREYKDSVALTNNDIKSTAKLVEKFQILPSAAIAEAAIPNCNIVYIDGTEMKTSIEEFYKVLFTANPKSIGGKLPDEDFYYRQ